MNGLDSDIFEITWKYEGDSLGGLFVRYPFPDVFFLLLIPRYCAIDHGLQRSERMLT